MPKHPDTGEDISNPVYEAIMSERKRAADLLDAEREAIANQLAAEPAQLSPPPQMMAAPKSSNTEKMLGCLIALLLAVILIGFPAGGIFAWKKIQEIDRPTPVAPVTPTVNLDALVKPIANKLAYAPDKAMKVRDAYLGFAEALQTKSADRVKDTRIFAAIQSAFLQDIDAGGEPAVGKEIDQAFAAHLGLQWGSDGPGEAAGWSFKSFTQTDITKLTEVAKAIGEAAGGTL